MKLPGGRAKTPPGPGDSHVDIVMRASGDALDVYLVQAEHRGVVDGIHSRSVRLRWFRPSWWRSMQQILVEVAGSYAAEANAALQSRFRKLRPTPRSLTAFAVLLAGRNHSASRDEWLSHLAGEPGHQLSRRDQMHAARSFVVAAVRYRIEDATELASQPVDAVLRSRTLSNIFIAGPVLAMVVAIVHHDGRFGLVADVQDPVTLGAFLYGMVRTGRWWRRVRPPEPKQRRVKE